MVPGERFEGVYFLKKFPINLCLQEKELFLRACVRVNGSFPFTAVDVPYIHSKLPHDISTKLTRGVIKHT